MSTWTVSEPERIAKGAEVPGYGLGDALPLRGDAVRAVPTWAAGRSLAALAGRTVVLELRVAGRLYALRGAFDLAQEAVLV